MPIYEYRCEACEHQLEQLQKMSDDPLRDCPECGKPALKRLVSAAAFRLKGSGWYETDFKKDNKRNLAESSSNGTAGKKPSASTSDKAGKSTSADSAAKTTAKPAAKPAAQGAKHA